MITLNITFGADQNIRAILAEIKKEVKSYTKVRKGDLVHYSIKFKSAWGVYLFGHTQGRFNPYKTINT